MRSEMVVGSCIGWASLAEDVKILADVSIFACMLVTSASVRSIHVRYGFDGAQRVRHKGNIDES
jgi:hypothetical protein